MANIYTGQFKEAVADYRYLIKREYPEKATLKIIGDRYSLNRVQRTILYRGVYCVNLSKRRSKRLTGTIKSKVLSIDCYNVVLTIANYMLGIPLYIGTDNLLRDAAESHGKSINEQFFYKALKLLLDYCSEHKVGAVNFFIDSPVSHSGKLALFIREELSRRGLEGDALTTKSPDHELIKIKRGLIATSDSIIIDKAEVKTVDLARQVLQRRYNPAFIRLNNSHRWGRFFFTNKMA